MWGGRGDDTLVGGRGDDVLTGGGGADTFAFSRKSGQDKIKDFNAAEGDVIDLSALGLRWNFDTFLARRATDTSEGVLLNLPGKSEVLLQGVNIADLSADDFIL